MLKQGQDLPLVQESTGTNAVIHLMDSVCEMYSVITSLFRG